MTTKKSQWIKPATAPALLQKGFTLVEMLLVLVILGVLASIVYPNLAHHSTRSKVVAAKAQLDAFRSALATFEIDNGHFPPSRGGLQQLVTWPNDAANWHGPYLDSVPLDPWENAYVYDCPGKQRPASYDLCSAGPDGEVGTEDDLNNWK